MARKKLAGLADLVDYDRGRVALAVQRGIEAIVEDLASRPTLDKPRSVALKVEFVPVVREGLLTLAYADVRVHVDLKLPAKRTAVQGMKWTSEGLEYDDLIRDDPSQTALPFKEEAKVAEPPEEDDEHDETDGTGG